MRVLTMTVLSVIFTGCAITPTRVAYNFDQKKIEIQFDTMQNTMYNESRFNGFNTTQHGETQ